MATHVAERRRHPRLSRELAPWRQVRLRTGDVLALVNIGSGGMLVESTRGLVPGSTLVVHLTSGDKSIDLRSRVLRCSVAALDTSGGIRYRAALEFQASEAGLASELR